MFLNFNESQVFQFTFLVELNAMLIVLEHRYYGKSVPVPDLTTPNMKYCSSEQALADIANFADVMGEQLKVR